MCNSLSIVATMTIESQPPATFETEATRGSLAPPTFVTSTWNVKTTQETPITTTSTMTDTLASAGTTAITESFSSTSTAGESTTISVELASNGNALYIDDALIGGIVGGAVGLLCLVVGAIVLVVVVRRRRSKKSDNSNDDLDEKEIQGQSVDRMSAATSNFAVVPQFRATTSEYDVGDIQS
jgi:beta-lactamase regulating signal transducer with metallopeptidase domain